MNDLYNFGVDLALADAGLVKTAGIGANILGALKKHPYLAAGALGLGGAGLAAHLLRKKEEEPGMVSRLLAGTGGVASDLLEQIKTNPRVHRGFIGGAGGAGLGALLGGEGHRGLGALIGGGLGAAGGAYAPEIAEAAQSAGGAAKSRAKRIIDDLVGTGA